MKEEEKRRQAYMGKLGLADGPVEIPESPGMPNPGISFTWLIAILIPILATILAQLTPKLRERLVEFLLEFYAEAMETPKVWDDFLARFLLRIFGIPIPEET